MTMMNDPYFRETVPDHVGRSVVYDFNIYAPEHEGLDLFESFKRLQDIGLPDIFWTRHNGGHWVAQRGDVITDIYKDTANFSSRRMLVPDEQNFETDFFIPLMADPPDHALYRRVAAAVFSPQRVMALENSVRELTASLVGELRPRGGCEFMADFSLQMPIIVFLGIMDLPLTDRERLLDTAGRIVRPQGEGELRDDALKSTFDYLDPILEQRRRHPGSDVISGIIQARKANGEPLNEDEVRGMAATLLTGGLDSVAASLGFFARFLADEPDQRRRLIADPGLVSRAADEMIRRYAPTTHGRSIATDQIFRGHDFRRKDHVVWAAAMYNLDDRIFPDPMTVDFNRHRNPHLSFGHGPHFCLGAVLARMEFKIFLEEWLKQIPEFSVTPGVEVKYRPGINISYQSLPLVWPN
jgi:cytochrome P450